MHKMSAAVVSSLLLLAGCPSGTPPSVTIGEVNCKRADITIVATAAASRVSPPPGSVYSVTAKVTVKCNDVGVEGAKITVKYWWGVVDSKNTDSSGEASFGPETANGAIPANTTVKVTVTPDVGDPFVKDTTVTVTN